MICFIISFRSYNAKTTKMPINFSVGLGGINLFSPMCHSSALPTRPSSLCTHVQNRLGFGWALSLKCFLSLHNRTHPFPSKSRTTRTYDYRLSASLFPSHIRSTTLMIPKRRCNLSNFLCWESVLFVFFCAQHLLGHFCHLFLQIDNAWQLFFRCKRKLNF